MRVCLLVFLASLLVAATALASAFSGSPPPTVDGCTGEDCAVQSLTSTGAVQAATVTSTGTVTSNAASGTPAFKVGVTGGRVCLDAGCLVYVGSNAGATRVVVSKEVEAPSIRLTNPGAGVSSDQSLIQGGSTSLSLWSQNATTLEPAVRLGVYNAVAGKTASGALLISVVNGTTATVLTVDKDGLLSNPGAGGGLLLPVVTALPTCASALRSSRLVYAQPGVAVDRECRCALLADGTSYGWVNADTGTVGTSTTCSP